RGLVRGHGALARAAGAARGLRRGHPPVRSGRVVERSPRLGLVPLPIRVAPPRSLVPGRPVRLLPGLAGALPVSTAVRAGGGSRVAGRAMGRAPSRTGASFLWWMGAPTLAAFPFAG